MCCDDHVCVGRQDQVSTQAPGGTLEESCGMRLDPRRLPFPHIGFRIRMTRKTGFPPYAVQQAGRCMSELHPRYNPASPAVSAHRGPTSRPQRSAMLARLSALRCHSAERRRLDAIVTTRVQLSTILPNLEGSESRRDSNRMAILQGLDTRSVSSGACRVSLQRHLSIPTQEQRQKPRQTALASRALVLRSVTTVLPAGSRGEP